MMEVEHKYPEELYESVKAQVISEAMIMREINQVVPISGERIDLPVSGRMVNIVYYSAEQKSAPLVIGFHGGGFLFGGNAMDDKMWCAVRDQLNVNVASVEYRKSPEFNYMEALEDAFDAAVYLTDHADVFGFDKNRVSVMGCSAGAALSATLCIYAKQKGKNLFQNQILMYPFLDAYTDPDSKGAGSLSGPIMYVFNELHSTHDEAKLSIVSPVYATEEELKDLPDAILCMAENDNLRHKGFRYGELLARAGVGISMTCIPEMPHGFFEYGFNEPDEKAAGFMGEDMIRLMENGMMSAGAQAALDFAKKHMA